MLLNKTNQPSNIPTPPQNFTKPLPKITKKIQKYKKKHKKEKIPQCTKNSLFTKRPQKSKETVKKTKYIPTTPTKKPQQDKHITPNNLKTINQSNPHKPNPIKHYISETITKTHISEKLKTL